MSRGVCRVVGSIKFNFQLWFAMLIRGLEDTRKEANKFATERNWGQFHTPNNILLALSGEIGEVCEIFQWKGDLDNGFDVTESSFTEAEVLHVGEEISDVIVYSCRLCDVTGIDLATAVKAKVTGSKLDSPRPCKIDDDMVTWGDYTFSELAMYTSTVVEKKSKSPRYYANKLSVYGGKLAALFLERKEKDNAARLERWTERDLIDMASIMSSIIVTMGCLGTTMNLQLEDVLADKLAKNNRKYPAHLAKNRSDKYTAYAQNNVFSPTNIKMFAFGAVILSLGFIIGRRA